MITEQNKIDCLEIKLGSLDYKLITPVVPDIVAIPPSAPYEYSAFIDMRSIINPGIFESMYQNPYNQTIPMPSYPAIIRTLESVQRDILVLNQGARNYLYDDISRIIGLLRNHY